LQPSTYPRSKLQSCRYATSVLPLTESDIANASCANRAGRKSLLEVDETEEEVTQVVAKDEAEEAKQKGKGKEKEKKK
jgi:hypothetical protein